MKMMMTMIIEMIILRNDTCMSKENIKYRLLPRRSRRAKEKRGRGTHAHETQQK